MFTEAESKALCCSGEQLYFTAMASTIVYNGTIYIAGLNQTASLGVLRLDKDIKGTVFLSLANSLHKVFINPM